MDFNHKEDGITHINIYSKSLSELGRLLSNFAETPFSHPTYGKFRSVEGFIFFLGSQDEALRTMHGLEAKQYGDKADKMIRLSDFNFKKAIRQALRLKLEYNPELKQKLKDSTLPLTHYYVMGRNKVAGPQKWNWMVAEWDLLRNELKKEDI